MEGEGTLNRGKAGKTPGQEIIKKKPILILDVTDLPLGAALEITRASYVFRHNFVININDVK